ncbi:hypothetical protein CFP71_28170 [Amycolatopsis thailandensis]|uniref:Endonuclease/exonuclease/phosphatase domain-containing protein n=1 Tax=Amycolatopsis thailandensis TaxID=589330 RepID=A0A229RUI0_9PSEU|nr:hypothetical protein [Amycolatopsis thailandensis]OXM50310.1 hypothetical protein CFP71_28170 [Amycolatopsis thailandensis]
MAGRTLRSKAGLAARRLRELGEATGLRCEYERNRPAVAVGDQRYQQGLLWSEEIEPAGGFTVVSGDALWHAYLQLDLDVGAKGPVGHASYHARPHGLCQRADDAEVVLKRVFRPPHLRPTLIGGDWNGVSADLPGWPPRARGPVGSWREYDHDPYHLRHGQPCTTVEWHPEFIYQCRTWMNADGSLGWEADRTAGRILRDGGLVDAAAALDVPWAATVGHWPGDQVCGPRRIDIVRTIVEVVSALVSCEVLATDLTRKASDHLPVLVRYAPAAIATGAWERAGG